MEQRSSVETKPNGKFINFQLSKQPKSEDNYLVSWKKKYLQDGIHLNSHFRPKTTALGSKETVYFDGDLGFFQAVFQAWQNHWNLRTTPEDWWNPIVTIIAKKVDSAAKKRQSVRNFFVTHQLKKTITVNCPVYTIYDVDYQDLFHQFSEGIQKNIKVPEYAQCMQCDFGTTTPTQRIASQIALMSSVQEFFNYKMNIMGCGLQGLEMIGTEEDWQHLVTKLDSLFKVLDPILSDLAVNRLWITHVQEVFTNLLKTYQGNQEAIDWWKNIIMKGNSWEWGPSGMNKVQVEAYNGWLIKFLTEREELKKDKLLSKDIKELGGLCEVPLEIILTYMEPPVRDQGTLVAGILGFKIHNDTSNHIPSIQAHHAWGLMLAEDSVLRKNQCA